MTQDDALEAAKLITGTMREIQGKMYTEDPTDAHERIDALMLSLLEKDYPELVAFVRKIKFWHG